MIHKDTEDIRRADLRHKRELLRQSKKKGVFQTGVLDDGNNHSLEIYLS